VFILGISPKGISPGNVEFPLAKEKKKGREGRRRGRTLRELLIPPGCEESRIQTDDKMLIALSHDC